MNAVLRSVSTCVVLAVLLALSGCFGATRMVTRERGSSGQQLEAKALDLAFVQPGTTTRDEVLAKLSMVNTGYDDRRLFWGRWATSTWGYWWMVVAPATNGGGGAGAGDAKRIWHVHNILISFDEQGVAQSKLLLDDDQPLWRELNKHAATLAPMDASEIISIHGEPRIALAGDWIEVARTKGKVRTVRVSPDKVLRIAHSGPPDKRGGPGTTCHTLYLGEKTAMGKKLSFCTDGAKLMATLRYLHRYASPNMQWE